MKITLDLFGWADTLTPGKPKILFAIACALCAAGKGIGYKIKFKQRPLFRGKTAVYNPYVFNVTYSTITSMTYIKGIKKDEHWEHKTINFTAQAYSVREIYKAALYELTKDKKKYSWFDFIKGLL